MEDPVDCDTGNPMADTQVRQVFLVAGGGLGCSERGRPQDGPLDHATGKGWVKGVKGDYYDALYVKKSRVVTMIVEAYGGITPHALAHIFYLEGGARRARRPPIARATAWRAAAPSRS